MVNKPVNIYVIFAGTDMLKAYKSRGQAMLTTDRLKRFNEFCVRREWELSSADYRRSCYNDDFENYAADERTYYTLRAVRFASDAL